MKGWLLAKRIVNPEFVTIILVNDEAGFMPICH
jgi:hypothetical protein